MEFSELIANIKSVRSYTDEIIAKDILDSILEMAQSAPSSKNSHSSAFMVVEDKDTLKALSEMRDRGSALIEGAAAAIIVMGDTTKTDLWEVNASISATFIHLAAVDCGLGSCWVHVCDRPRQKDDPSKGSSEDYVRELLGIKDQYRILCAVALGYPKER